LHVVKDKPTGFQLINGIVLEFMVLTHQLGLILFDLLN
jgi:hypothetical protein